MPASARRLTAIALLLVSGMAAEARLVGPADGFEQGNRGQWTASGAASLRQAPPAGRPGFAPRQGKNYVLLSNEMPFPAAALTTTVNIEAKKGAPCTLELWVHAPGKTGAVLLSIRQGFATGPLLAERRFNAPVASSRKGSSGYVLQRLNFPHPGAPLFVIIAAAGPIEAAIDDFALRCRAR
jgi:hypothetical protein